MASGRPSVPEGIGAKPQFKSLGLELVNEKDAEFSPDDNIFDIEMKYKDKPLKTTFKLVQYKDGKENELPEGVFTQTKDKRITFHVALPEPGWYKLNIFAMPLDGDGNTLPNVFTYLINLKQAKKAVKPYPKQFADFAKGCYLKKPLFLDTSKDLSNVEFKVEVEGAKRVAVKAGDEWFHLTNKGGNVWEGEANLKNHKGETVNLNACTGSDETQFATLLQYQL